MSVPFSEFLAKLMPPMVVELLKVAFVFRVKHVCLVSMTNNDIRNQAAHARLAVMAPADWYDGLAGASGKNLPAKAPSPEPDYVFDPSFKQVVHWQSPGKTVCVGHSRQALIVD